MTGPGATRSLGPAGPIPLTVLTGFLGAGKTSLLNRLIVDPALADTAVIINEFGEVGLDHLLIKPIKPLALKSVLDRLLAARTVR